MQLEALRRTCVQFHSIDSQLKLQIMNKRATITAALFIALGVATAGLL